MADAVVEVRRSRFKRRSPTHHSELVTYEGVDKDERLMRERYDDPEPECEQVMWERTHDDLVADLISQVVS